jgi:hypothetical protein
MFLTVFLALILLGMPEAYSFVNTFDLTLMSGEIIGVAGACVIATGLPCAGALAIFGLLNIVAFIVVADNIIKFVIFTPLTVVFIYLIAKLARGTGG